MNIDSLTDYIIPVGLLLLYFFVSSGKKRKQKPPSQAPVEKPVERSPVRREPLVKKAPPQVKSWEPPGARGKNRVVESTLAVRQLNTAVESDLSSQILSEGMQKYSQNDTDIVAPPKRRDSRTNRLFKEKEAFVTQFS